MNSYTRHSPRGTSSTMRREVEKNPLAVLEMKEPGQLPTSSLMLWMPSMIANPPARMHTPAGGREGGREGVEEH